MLRFIRRVRQLWCEHEYIERVRTDRHLFECVACGKRQPADLDVTPVERRRLEALVRMGARRSA